MRFLLIFPALLILITLTSGCTTEDPGLQPDSSDGPGFDTTDNRCRPFDPKECPDDCVICPPCEECSSVSCQTEEFCLSIGFDKDWYSDLHGPSDAPSQEVQPDDGPPTDDSPPTIYNIGIDLEPWDPLTNFAGDVDFGGEEYSDRIFLPFGADEGDGEFNPHPMFVLPLGTEIHSVSEGVVGHVTSLGDDDYDICVVRYMGDPWCISYEHISQAKVKVGDPVKIGQVLGEAGRINEFTEYGKFDLKIWNGGSDIIDYCPYALLDESVRDGIYTKMSSFFSEWEDYIGKDIYDQDSWHAPGCLVETVMEYPSGDQSQEELINAYENLEEHPWPTFHGSPQHGGLSPYDTSHVDGTVRWEFDAGAAIESSPVIAKDGTIYVGSHNGYLFAINQDGTEKWRFDAGPPNFDERWNVSKSIMATPAIAKDGTIYILSSANYLFAINPDGTEKWRFFVLWGNDFWSSPTIANDGTIYIGSARSQEDPGYDGGLHAVNPDGTEKWLFLDDSGVTSVAAIGDDGTIYFGGNIGNPKGGNFGTVYALTPGGSKIWEFVIENWMESSPVIAKDGTIYTGSGREARMFALNPDGSEKWRFSADEGWSAVPAIGKDGTIYAGAWDANFFAINPDGSEKWRYKTPDAFEGVISSAAIGSDGTIHVGSNSGNFYAFNPDGTVKWTFATVGAGIVSSPAIGADGTIFFGAWDHKLYAIGGPGMATITSSEETPDNGPYEIQDIPTCPEDNELFAVSPMKPSDLMVVVPLGGLNPPGHTFPTRHVYFRFTYAPISHTLPVYSPGDITVTSISSMEQPGFTDYTLSFDVCDGVSGYLSHLSGIEQVFQFKLANSDDCHEYETGGTSFRMCTSYVNVPVKEGERIASAGGTEMGHIDFELYDTRTEPLDYVNKDRWIDAKMDNGLYVVCPVDYFVPSVKDKLYGMFGSHTGDPRTIPPLCGKVMYDVPGTALGLWYSPEYATGMGEDPHLFLGYDNIDPTLAVFSVGNNAGNLGSGLYYYEPLTEGQINRDFKDITPGDTYCFETKDRWGEENQFTILLQLTDSSNLKIQKRASSSCGSGPWSFSEPADFER